MRLKPGATIERANSEMAMVMAGLATDFPAADKNRVYVSKPLVDSIVGDLGPILIIVMSATGLLLLLACVNVANLLLARGAARAREMAVARRAGRRVEPPRAPAAHRIAGAGRRRDDRGRLRRARRVSARCSRSARRSFLVSTPCRSTARVLLFSLAMLIVTGVIIGFAPAVRLMRTDMKSLMNDSSRSASAGRGTARWLMAMTVAEVALAIMLVAGAGGSSAASRRSATPMPASSRTTG